MLGKQKKKLKTYNNIKFRISGKVSWSMIGHRSIGVVLNNMLAIVDVPNPHYYSPIQSVTKGRFFRYIINNFRWSELKMVISKSKFPGRSSRDLLIVNFAM